MDTSCKAKSKRKMEPEEKSGAGRESFQLPIRLASHVETLYSSHYKIDSIQGHRPGPKLAYRSPA